MKNHSGLTEDEVKEVHEMEDEIREVHKIEEKYIREHGVEYSLAKAEAVFAVLCPYCKHRWGNHAMLGCMHKDCYKKKDGCDYDGIRAIRLMMKDPDFKFTFVPEKKEKMEVQTTL